MPGLLLKNGRVVLANSRGQIQPDGGGCGCCGGCQVPACCSSGGNCFVVDPLAPLVVQMRVRMSIFFDSATGSGSRSLDTTVSQSFAPIGGTNKCAAFSYPYPAVGSCGDPYVFGPFVFTGGWGTANFWIRARFSLTRDGGTLDGGWLTPFSGAPCGYIFNNFDRWTGTSINALSTTCCTGLAQFPQDPFGVPATNTVGQPIEIWGLEQRLDFVTINKCDCNGGNVCPATPLIPLAAEAGCSGCTGRTGQPFTA